MADTPDITACADTSAGRDDFRSPFFALNYHFGMLLGVDDFATEQQYHHGKMRLHNAWLHRAGVVWGFGVRLDPSHGEIRVLPGLALDASGHELHLDGDACVNVVEWYLTHKDDDGFSSETTDTGVKFDARVEIRFTSCLTRQVPALVEPCEGSAGGTAYSRLFETVDIQLRPGTAPAPAPRPYHRLRVLFNLDEPVLPADQSVVDARDAVQALGTSLQPAAYLQELRKFAALDEIDLQPAKSGDDTMRLIFPEAGGAPVVIADITGITLDRSGENNALKLTGGTVDVTVRPSHIATATIQELLCGPLFSDVAPLSGEVATDAASGPRVLPASVQITDIDVDFDLDQDLHAQSAVIDSFFVSTFTDADGWTDLPFTVTVTSGPSHVNLHLKNALEEDVRWCASSPRAPVRCHSWEPTLRRWPAPSAVLSRRRTTVSISSSCRRGTRPMRLPATKLAPPAEAAGGPGPGHHSGLYFVFVKFRS